MLRCFPKSDLQEHARDYLYIFLKYVSKICGLNYEIDAVTSSCIRFFSFKALTEYNLVFEVL